MIFPEPAYSTEIGSTKFQGKVLTSLGCHEDVDSVGSNNGADEGPPGEGGRPEGGHLFEREENTADGGVKGGGDSGGGWMEKASERGWNEG